MSANVPELRFSGFADPWEQRKLGEVCSIERGERFTAADYVESGGIPCIHYGEGYTDYGPVATEAISPVCPGLEGRLRYANPGDIILTSTSENVEDVCKAVAWMGKTQVSYHDDSFALSHSEDSLFLTSYFQTGGFSEQKAAMAHGVKVMRVSQEDLANISIPLPCLPEQRAVGALFSRLDSLIALHQRKHNQLSVLKGSLLEGMFPKPGSDVPELRFSGFADPWEQRKLGDVYRKCTEKNDGTYNTNSIISVAGMSYSPETRVTEQSYLGTYNVMRLGDIAFEGHANRVFSHGRFVENDLGIGIVSHIFDVFRPKVEYDLSYWRYAINNESLMRNVLIRSTKASTMMHNLVTSDFLKQSIPVPTVAEQKKIGGVLVRLDSLIALHQRKLEKLRALKQSLLQKMFV